MDVSNGNPLDEFPNFILGWQDSIKELLNEQRKCRELVLYTETLSEPFNLVLQKDMSGFPLKYLNKKKLIGLCSVNYPTSFECSLVRDFVSLLEFEVSVLRYSECPLEIPYKDTQGRKAKYIPDFAVSYLNGRQKEIIEIEYEDSLNSNKEEFALKFDAARKFCKRKNYTFKVLTESFIRREKKIELDNCKFLSRYKNFYHMVIDKASQRVSDNQDFLDLFNLVLRTKETTINNLVEMCSKDSKKREHLVFLSWCLVARRFIKADLSTKLDENSKIWESSCSNYMHLSFM